MAGEAGMIPHLALADRRRREARNGGRPMKRPTDRLLALAMLAVGVARFAQPRDSGKRLRGRHGGESGAHDR